MTQPPSPALFDLRGRTALITGSSRGIGLAMARGLAQAGARVIINSRQTGAVDEAVSTLRAEGLQAQGAVFDVADEASVAAAFRAEWARHDIQANSIGPGYILTDMNEALVKNAEFDAWVKASNPAQRWGRPEELVGTAVFLASAASNYINGQIIYVDGGWLSVL